MEWLCCWCRKDEAKSEASGSQTSSKEELLDSWDAEGLEGTGDAVDGVGRPSPSNFLLSADAHSIVTSSPASSSPLLPAPKGSPSGKEDVLPETGLSVTVPVSAGQHTPAESLKSASVSSVSPKDSHSTTSFITVHSLSESSAVGHPPGAPSSLDSNVYYPSHNTATSLTSSNFVGSFKSARTHEFLSSTPHGSSSSPLQQALIAKDSASSSTPVQRELVPQPNFQCNQISSLVNQPGRLCSIFGQRYVLIDLDGAQVLVTLERHTTHGLTSGTKLLWQQELPRVLSDVADGEEVVCDALSVPDTHRFHALVVWQGKKPAFVEEPIEEDEVLVLESHNSPVRWLEVSENGGGSLHVDIRGKTEIIAFAEEVVFLNGEKATSSALHSAFHSHSSTGVFATVHRAVKGGIGQSIIFLCSCVWCGTPPGRILLATIKVGDVYAKNQNGSFVKTSASQRLYFDLPGVLKVTQNVSELVVKCESETHRLYVPKEKVSLENKIEHTLVSLEIPVHSHILRRKEKASTVHLEVLRVHLPSAGVGDIVDSQSDDMETNRGIVSGSKGCDTESVGSTSMGNRKARAKRKKKRKRKSNAASGVDNNASQIKSPQPKTEGSTPKGSIEIEQQEDGSTLQKKADEAPKGESSSQKSESQQKGELVESDSSNSTISVEECQWLFGSISQGIAKTSTKTILVSHEVLYIDGEKISATDTVAKYATKDTTLRVASVVFPGSALGTTVTHKALLAWHGSKPDCFDRVLNGYRSGNQKQEQMISTELRRTVSSDRMAISAPSLHSPMALATEYKVHYFAGCRFKIVGISQGIVCGSSRVILIEHRVFYFKKQRVASGDPLSKYSGNEFPINGYALPAKQRCVMNHSITHRAVVAWVGKKPASANAILKAHLEERQKSKVTSKSSSADQLSNRRPAGLQAQSDSKGVKNNVNKETPSKKNAPKNVAKTVSNTAKTTPKGKANTKSEKQMIKENQRLSKALKKKLTEESQGKLVKAGGDHGFLEVRCEDREGGKATVFFHRSVVFVNEKPVDSKVNLATQLYPFYSKGRNLHCAIKRHDIKVGDMACSFVATLVWVGKKPQPDAKLEAKEKQKKEAKAKKKAKEKQQESSTKKINNASCEVAFAGDNVAVLKLAPNAPKGSVIYAHAQKSVAFVNQKAVETTNELLAHSVWQCDLKKRRKPGAAVHGFVCLYEAKVVWVGKKPSEFRLKKVKQKKATNKAKTPVGPSQTPAMSAAALANAHGTVVFFTDETAVIKMKNKTLTLDSCYVFVRRYVAFVHGKRIEKASDMANYLVWCMSVKVCQVPLLEGGLRCSFEAEVAWVGKKPSAAKVMGDDDDDDDDEAAEVSSLYEDLFPVAPAEDNTEIVDLAN